MSIILSESLQNTLSFGRQPHQTCREDTPPPTPFRDETCRCWQGLPSGGVDKTTPAPLRLARWSSTPTLRDDLKLMSHMDIIQVVALGTSRSLLPQIRCILEGTSLKNGAQSTRSTSVARFTCLLEYWTQTWQRVQLYPVQRLAADN